MVDKIIGPVVVDGVMNFFGNGVSLSPLQKSCKLKIEVVPVGVR